MYIYSLLDSFPIQVITEYWVEFPVLYSRSLLVIYFTYSSVYMSVPISKFISPPSQEKFLKEIKSVIPVNTGMIRK